MEDYGALNERCGNACMRTHNPKVAASTPAPATIESKRTAPLGPFCFSALRQPCVADLPIGSMDAVEAVPVNRRWRSDLFPWADGVPRGITRDRIASWLAGPI